MSAQVSYLTIMEKVVSKNISTQIHGGGVYLSPSYLTPFIKKNNNVNIFWQLLPSLSSIKIIYLQPSFSSSNLSVKCTPLFLHTERRIMFLELGGRRVGGLPKIKHCFSSMLMKGKIELLCLIEERGFPQGQSTPKQMNLRKSSKRPLNPPPLIFGKSYGYGCIAHDA